MSEDVSVYTRLAVTVSLMAALTVVILNMSIMSSMVLERFSDNYSTVAASTAPSALIEMAGKSKVNAISAYKILEMNAGSGNQILVTIGGTTTSNTDGLLNIAHKDVVVHLTEVGNNYKIVVTEVP